MTQIQLAIAQLKKWLPLLTLITVCILLAQEVVFYREEATLWFDADYWEWVGWFGSMVGIPAMVAVIGFPNKIPKKLLLVSLGVWLPCYLMVLIFDPDSAYRDMQSNIIVFLAFLGVAFLFYALKLWLVNKNSDLLIFCVLLVLFAFVMGQSTTSMLSISALIFPNVYDVIVYKIDAAFGDLRHQMVLFGEQHVLYHWVLDSVYGFLPLCMFVMMGLLLRYQKYGPYHVLRTIIIPYGVAFLMYSIVPMSGPLYAFGDQVFDQMPAPDLFAATVGFIAPAARNGMPSMHYTGAFLLVMLAAVLPLRRYFWAAVGFWLLTILATIVKAEHYILDLIVAAPFAVVLGLGLIAPLGWRQDKRLIWAWCLAAMTFVSWLIGIIAFPWYLSDHLLLVQAWSLWSVVIAAYVFFRYLKLVHSPAHLAAVAQWQAPATIDVVFSGGAKVPHWIMGVFVASGFAGLLYEVVYAKSLAITFGSTSLASYTVLVVYMGGMALGAWIGGMLADKVSQPLRYYLGIEAVIGVYAVVTPWLFQWVQQLYLFIAIDQAPDADMLTVARVGLGAFVLGIPTILMGATVPFMFKHLKQIGTATDAAVSKLYSANVFGAALGSLVAAYALLPILGRNGATNLAAAISLMVALYVLDRIKVAAKAAGAQSLDFPYHNESITATDDSAAAPIIPVALPVGIAAMIVLWLGGGVTLALEVVSIHMLAVIAGNSVYAFGLMLATFLLGLAAGSAAGKKLLEQLSAAMTVVLAWCGVAVCITMTALLWDGLPNYFASFGVMQQFHHFTFWLREMLRAAVCAIAMFPAAFFIGVSYPAAMSLAVNFWAKKGATKALGLASAVNTLGNILGVLLMAFVALPMFGSNRVFLFLAVICLVLAAVMWLAALMTSPNTTNNRCLLSLNQQQKTMGTLIIAGCALLAIYPRQWDISSLSQGANVYFGATPWGTVIDYSESISGGMTAVAQNPENKTHLTLLTNGKFQGNNTGETKAQEMIALSPLLHTDKRNNALVIGYGTGMTLRVLYDQHFKELDVAELAKDMVTMADRYFTGINHGTSKKPGVNLYYTDGRNYLLTQNKQYDLISMEISSIWFAGAGNLYNKEFYQLAKKRLRPDGVLQQWIQLHHIYPQDLIYVLNSVRSEFRYVWLYVLGGQGIIVASNSEAATHIKPLAMPYMDLSDKQTQALVDEIKEGMLLSPAGVDALAKKTDPTLRYIVSTDNNLYLEYATPKGNAAAYDTYVPNIEFLAQFEPSTHIAQQETEQSGRSK